MTKTAWVSVALITIGEAALGVAGYVPWWSAIAAPLAYVAGWYGSTWLYERARANRRRT